MWLEASKTTSKSSMPLEENVIEVARESSSLCNTEGDTEPSTNNYLTVLNLPSDETGDSESDEDNEVVSVASNIHSVNPTHVVKR